MNGAVEAANKNVKKILSKMTDTYKDWHEHFHDEDYKQELRAGAVDA